MRCFVNETGVESRFILSEQVYFSSAVSSIKIWYFRTIVFRFGVNYIRCEHGPTDHCKQSNHNLAPSVAQRFNHWATKLKVLRFDSQSGILGKLYFHDLGMTPQCISENVLVQYLRIFEAGQGVCIHTYTYIYICMYGQLYDGYFFVNIGRNKIFKNT